MSFFFNSDPSSSRCRAIAACALLASLFTASLGNLNANTLAGSLPGGVAVNNTGSATYSMPISLPAGVAGMAPELGINYDSSGGNGLLGMGFGLDGLSAISRTPTTLEQDDLTDGIDFDNNDRFSLDGQRLVCVAGTYGAPGSEYRTEIDSFVRVIAHGTAASGPNFFTVETKAGLTKTYGLSSAAALIYDSSSSPALPEDGSKVTWMLEKVEDTNGNAITYHYLQDAQSEMKYISEIWYGDPGSLFKVVFEYEDRNDKIPSFLIGVDYAAHRRLAKISAYSGVSEIHNYALNYEVSLQRNVSRVKMITFTSSDSGQSASTTFEWNDNVPIAFDQGSQWLNGTYEKYPFQSEPGREDAYSNAEWSKYIYYSPYEADLIDYDGDGLLERLISVGIYDALFGDGYDGSSMSLAVAENSNHDFLNEVQVFQALVPSVDEYPTVSGPGQNTSTSIDFESSANIAINSIRSKVHNHPNSYEHSADRDRNSISNDILDIDGDGDLDLLRTRYYSPTHLYTLNGVPVYDFGDAIEGMHIYRNENGVFSATPETWYSSDNWAQNLPLWKYQDSTLATLKDMNGDGLLDKVDHAEYQYQFMWNGYPLTSVSSHGLYVSLNNGNGFNTASLWYQSSTDSLNYPQVSSSSGSVSADLIDVNGDGLLDKVDHFNPDSAGSNSGMWISLNNGNGFEAKTRWLNGSEESQHKVRWVNQDGSEYSTFIDMNGDRLLDRVDHREYESNNDIYGLWVSINNGSSFEDKKLWYQSLNKDEQNYPLWRDEHGIKSRLLDMNGDGLPDRVDHADYSSGSSVPGVYVSINNGNGFNQKHLWYASSEPNQCRSSWIHNSAEADVFSDLLDINGDGLPDKIDHYNYTTGQSGLWVSLNTGSDFDTKFLLSQNQNLIQNYNSDHYHFFDANQEHIFSELKDVNGDGFLDRIYVDNGLFVETNAASLTLLKSVTNNLGVTTEITYKPLTDSSVYTKGVGDNTPPTVTVQNSMHVVSSITKDIGLNDANGDPISYVTEYTYAEARYHTRGRGFLGFRMFESYDVQTQLTKTEILHHDFPYTGMKTASMTYGPNGQLLSYTENTLNCKGMNLKPGETGNDHDDYYTVFPFVEESKEWKGEYEPATDFSGYTPEDFLDYLIGDDENPQVVVGNAYGHTTTTNEFDANGNNLEIFIDYGDGYTQLTENLYAYDNVAAWYIGRLSSAEVTSVAPNTTGQNETIIRKSSFTYDSNGLLLTETVEPNHALSVTTTYTRDAQGRITSTSVDPADGPAITTETHSILDSTGRFYTKTTNALNHAETRVYDPTRGWVDSQTGPNLRTSFFTYDALGRAIREDRPDGTWSTTAYTYDNSQTVTNPGNGLSYTSAYSVTSTASQSTTSVTWYDRLGRAIRACTEGYDGQIIYQDTGYNALGQVDCVSENYYAVDGAALWTKTTFDALGRADVATAPDGTKATTIYNGRETTSIRNYQGTDTVNTNANDQTTKTLLNAKGDKQTVTSYNQSQQPLTIDYHYDGVGNLLETVTTSPNDGTRTISMSYDIRGNKTGMVDPDMGTWAYSYNALGQLVSQTDAVGNISSKIYDILGRITEETYHSPLSTPHYTTHNYYYDGTGEHQQLGKLHLETSSTGFRRSHYYDDLGRSFLTLSKIEGRWFYQQTDYDSYSRPVRLTHYWRPPSLDEASGDHHLAWYSYSQETLYDDRSFVTEVRDANGQTWWSAPVYNQYGQLTSYLAGNQLTTESEYDDARHVLERITIKAGANTRLDHSYQFDSIGNLIQRQDEVKSLTENLYYDNLNRLTSSSVVSGSTLTMTYDDLGNIESRDSTGTLGDVGSYVYTANTNRVSNAGGRGFTYNSNGSITSVTGTSSGNITWAAFNKPYTMESNNKRSAFSYDTGNSRVTQTRETDIGSSQWLTNSRKTYVGSLFEQEQAWEPATGVASSADQLDRTKWDITSTRIYISTPSGVVGSWISEVGQAIPKKTLFLRDHLGSVIAETDLADPYGAISKEFSYDAWGLARDSSDWDGAPATTPNRVATDRGFTGHEMLDDLGLIHMNGRIYDPLLGRMLSADPNIQAPSELQNYNRYSYVLNNPVSMTDPSGFFFKNLFKKIGKLLGSAFQVIITIAIAAIPVVGAYLAAAWIALHAYRAGGFKAALIAIAAIAVTWGIGQYFDSFYGAGDALRSGVELARATSHGIAQGGFAELQGGDFGASFLAGFSGSLAGSMITAKSGKGSYFGEATDKGKYLVRRTVAASVVGGTAAELGGGKFANGATTAAMVHLFNHEELFKNGNVLNFERNDTIYPSPDPVDINLMSPGDSAYPQAAYLPDSDTIITLFGHGTNTYIERQSLDAEGNIIREHLNVDKVASIIMKHAEFNQAEAVCLYSCSTGYYPPGGRNDSLAYQLSGLIKKPVIAPSGIIYAPSLEVLKPLNGDVYRPSGRRGNWQVFNNN